MEAPASGHGVRGRDRVPEPVRDSPGDVETVFTPHQHCQGDGDGRVVNNVFIVSAFWQRFNTLGICF